MTKKEITNLTLAGYITIDSGQAMIGDPCYLDKWNTNENDEWNLEGKVGEYSYHGASATTLANDYGALDSYAAVVFSTGSGDGFYPVYVQINDEGKVSKVVIDFYRELSEDTK
jgi:hypothetical protein